jgi:hypothetical protein
MTEVVCAHRRSLGECGVAEFELAGDPREPWVMPVFVEVSRCAHNTRRGGVQPMTAESIRRVQAAAREGS